ncbi:hypothetical protein CRENBAI_009959 [Crenichthys baileyi]|uniref:Uncharacterized protein n=1 Tax=Crenichthys baileyi TaxID=28760 RepID=A0AAV9QPX9_9TELE
MERIWQMERDYETAVRQFYCGPPSTPGLQGAAAAAAEQPTPGLQGAAAAAAEQPTPGLQPGVELPEGPEGGLPLLPGPEHLLSFLWGVLMELRPDTPQPVSARPDTPQPVSARPDTPQPVSTSSIRRRGRRKRDVSVHATGGLCDAPALAHVTEGPTDASAPSLQGFSWKLVLVLASEPCDKGFEEEAPPVPVSGDFKGQFVLVLASEPLDEGFEEEAPQDPALLRPLRVCQALPLRVRQAFAGARLNSVLARDDLLVARLNSVPARDDLLVARLNSVPARDDLLVARLNSVPARDDLLVARPNSVPVSGPPAVASTAHPVWVVFWTLVGVCQGFE